MANLDLKEISNVRIGKHITLEIDSPDKATAEKRVEEACKKLLANPIIESYEFELKEG
jgi:phosphoribosylformylglycinamidine synthase